jgi:hypothetical protein
LVQVALEVLAVSHQPVTAAILFLHQLHLRAAAGGVGPLPHLEMAQTVDLVVGLATD